MASKRIKIKRLLVSLLIFPLLLPVHEMHDTQGFFADLSRSALGLGHLLVMLLLGIISAQIGGCAIQTVPCVLVLFMFIGGLILRGGEFFNQFRDLLL